MTTFQIVMKTIRTLMSINGVEVVVGQKYDIALQSQLKLENLTSYKGEPFDNFKYKIDIDNTTSSNTATVAVSFETDKVGNPPTVTAVQDVSLNSSLYFTDVVDPDNHFDRIAITVITGKGAWTYNNLPLVVGQIFFYYDLVSKLKFAASSPGVQNNYAVLTYDTVNIVGPHLQTNTITINSIALGAELSLLSFSSYLENDGSGTEILQYVFQISKGIINATYEMAIDTVLLTGLDTNPLDVIDVQERDLTLVEISTSGVLNRTSTLDENGETVYYFIIHKNTVTTNGINIFITLNTVNSLTANVNPLYDQINLFIPPTPTPSPGEIQV